MYPIRLVVQQQIAGTYTYKVIYPTRNNFGAVNIFDRETMWAPITANELQAAKDRETQAKNEEAAAKVKEQEALDKLRNKDSDSENLAEAYTETFNHYEQQTQEFTKERDESLKQLALREDEIVKTQGREAFDKLYEDTWNYYESAEAQLEKEKQIVLKELGTRVNNSEAITESQDQTAAREAFKKEEQLAEAAAPIVDTNILIPNPQAALNEQAKQTQAASETEAAGTTTPATADTQATRTVLEQYNINLKSQGVNVQQLNTEALNAIVVAGTLFNRAGQTPVITSAYDSFEDHSATSKHRTGSAVDFRTKDLTLTQEQKVKLAADIQAELNKGSYQYYVLYEDPGGDREHIHIQFNGVTQDQVQKNILE